MSFGFGRSIDLSLTVNKSTNRVFFVEADKDFVDVLLSFLTLPLGTIISIANEGRINNRGPIHCLGNLYRSVKDLKEDHFKVDTAVCKEMLLKPRHAAELECLDLTFNLEDDRALTYYACNQLMCHHKVLSPYMGTKCICGGDMRREMKITSKMTGKKDRHEGVFLKGIDRYIITDDFVIMPASSQTVLMLLGRLDGEQKRNLEEKSLNFGITQVQSLLYCSMISENAFTDVLDHAEKGKRNDIAENVQQKLARLALKPLAIPSSESGSSENKINIKLIIDKHENKVLYAECNQDFIDSIFGFLTYPSGYVLKNLNRNSHITCFENLYASAANPAFANHFKTDESKEYIVNPSLKPSFFESNNGLITVRETNAKSSKNIEMTIIKGANINEFVCEATYIVTDDLVVNPSISYVTCLVANVIDGVKEVAANVGKKELFWLLEAALCSTTALTDVFLN